MDDVSVRELRNSTSAVLRAVEEGQTVRVTVDRRAVAELVPLRRPAWVSGERMQAALADARADSGLEKDLAALLPQATDEL